MTKQTIEIDVPEMYKLGFHNNNCNQYYGIDPRTGEEMLKLILAIKEKELEFIEVREYLFTGWAGNILLETIQKDLGDNAATIESSPHFIKWIDDDWRKIYI